MKGYRGIMVVACALMMSCDRPDAVVDIPADASPQRGRTVIATLGCGACHDIPGITWPQGQVGPPLHDYGDRMLIAGTVTNSHETLAQFITNAPALVPGTGMPPIPMTDEDARDAAAYLHSLRSR